MGCVTWLRRHLKRRGLNHTESRKIDRKTWVYQTEEGWKASKKSTKAFVDECLAFDRKRKREREDESEARKQARHDVEAAAYCYYADQKAAKAAKVAKAVKGVKAGEAVEAAQAPKDVKVVKVPKADKAVQVRLPSDAAPAPVQKAAVFTAPESVPSVSTETTRVPSASSASVVSAPDTLTTTEKEANGVSAKPSNGEMVVSGLAESVAKMRCHIGMLSTKYPGVSPQITSAAAGGLKRILDNMDLVILALRSHVQ